MNITVNHLYNYDFSHLTLVLLYKMPATIPQTQVVSMLLTKPSKIVKVRKINLAQIFRTKNTKAPPRMSPRKNSTDCHLTFNTDDFDTTQYSVLLYFPSIAA